MQSIKERFKCPAFEPRFVSTHLSADNFRVGANGELYLTDHDDVHIGCHEYDLAILYNHLYFINPRLANDLLLPMIEQVDGFDPERFRYFRIFRLLEASVYNLYKKIPEPNQSEDLQRRRKDKVNFMLSIALGLINKEDTSYFDDGITQLNLQRLSLEADFEKKARKYGVIA